MPRRNPTWVQLGSVGFGAAGARAGCPRPAAAHAEDADEKARAPRGARRRPARLRPGSRAAHLAEMIPQRREVAGEIPGRGVALLRILGEAAVDDPAQGRGRARGRARDRRLGSSRMIAVSVSAAVSRLPGAPARDHLVQDRAERELVGAGSERACPRACSGDMYPTVPRILPSSVGTSSYEPVCSPALASGPLRDSEVQDLEEAVRRHHEVLGLQVAVDDPEGMGGRERVGQLGGQVERLPRRRRAVGEDSRTVVPRRAPSRCRRPSG